MYTLIELVLERYSKHPCVIGFGVDVEQWEEGIKMIDEWFYFDGDEPRMAHL